MFVSGIKINILRQHRARAKEQGFRSLTIQQYFAVALKLLTYR